MIVKMAGGNTKSRFPIGKKFNINKPREDGWCDKCGAGAVESGMHRCEKHKSLKSRIVEGWGFEKKGDIVTEKLEFRKERR
jgi:hypothetical protein